MSHSDIVQRGPIRDPRLLISENEIPSNSRELESNLPSPPHSELVSRNRQLTLASEPTRTRSDRENFSENQNNNNNRVDSDWPSMQQVENKHKQCVRTLESDHVVTPTRNGLFTSFRAGSRILTEKSSVDAVTCSKKDENCESSRVKFFQSFLNSVNLRQNVIETSSFSRLRETNSENHEFNLKYCDNVAKNLK